MAASAEFSSTLSLPILADSLYLRASSYIVGPSARQGGHHGAQKSTSTGRSLPRTSDWKFASLKVNAS